MKDAKFYEEIATTVGGSGAHNLFNTPPYGCRRKMYYEKTTEEQDFPFIENKDMQRGTAMEKVISSVYMQKSGEAIAELSFKRHRSEPRMGYHPDGLSVRHGNLLLLEIKCPGIRSYWKIKTRGLPDAWTLQVQHGMEVMDIGQAVVFVMNAEQWEHSEFLVSREVSIGSALLAETQSFWQQVDSRDPPERLPADDKRCRTCPYRTRCQGQALLDAIASEEGPELADLPRDDSLTQLTRQYVEARAIVAEAEEIKEQARAALLEAIGDRSRLAADTYKILATATTRHSLDTKGLQADYPEIAQKYERKTVFRSLRVIDQIGD